MGAGQRVQAPPRAAAQQEKGQTEPGAREGSMMPAGTAAAGAWVLVLALWGAAVGGLNVTARMGEPLVLGCKGASKKPPQQLEWKVNTGRTEAWKVLSPQGGPWDSVARILPNGSLLLPAIGIVDEGTFRCRVINRHGKEVKSNYRVRVYQIPGKPEIVDPASELTAGVPNKVAEIQEHRKGPLNTVCAHITSAEGEVSVFLQVGTCVSEGGYPAGTLRWHLDGKPLTPDGKGECQGTLHRTTTTFFLMTLTPFWVFDLVLPTTGTIVKEETRRHPETGLFTLQSELTVTPSLGGTTHPTFSCSFSPGLPRRRPLNTAPIQPRVKELVPPEGIQLLVEPEGGTVAPGGTVTLTCAISVQPPPEIHWIKDGTPLPLTPGPVLLLSEVGQEDEGIYSCVATHPSLGPQESHPVSISVTETGEEGSAAGEGELKSERSVWVPHVTGTHTGTTSSRQGRSAVYALNLPYVPTGSVGGSGLGTLALALGILGGLGIAALLTGAILWRKRRARGEERKAPENQEDEEERAELNQSDEAEAAENGAGGP